MSTAPTPPAPGQGADIQDFILARELAEVYLLLDNISSGKSKMIPTDANDIFAKDKTKTWLEQICEIAWPPDPQDHSSHAANAAKLIRAKDMLNIAAAPATGASIAFTLTVVGESRDPQTGVPWWRRGLLWLADALPGPVFTASGGFTGTGNGGGTGDGGPPPPPTRASLAALAYPTFARRAVRYRIAFFSLIIFLMLWLIVTCFVSWDIATGSSLLNRVNALDTVRLAAQQTGDGSASSGPARQQVSVQPGPQPNRAPPPPPAGGAANGPQQAPVAANAGTNANTTTTTTTTTTTKANAPDQPDRNELARRNAADNLLHWLQKPTWLRQLLIGRMGGGGEPYLITQPAAPAQAGGGPAAPPAAAPPEANVEWAAVCIAVLAGTILPIFYGLLGAAAAVVRSVSAKIRDSTLMPRDLGLAYVQLALGAVIGACVGLFVASDGGAGATQQGLLGSVHLSAPALCFVAGFGVEGVFQALESLMRRVFNIEQPKPTTP
ncbi:MAG: hypothetical protein QOH81_181 [Sphingomonadales bacterium]|nr:hypothetical protein [Sphingomonadales bacterium]